MWSRGKNKHCFDSFCAEYTFEFRVVLQNYVTRDINFAKLCESPHNYSRQLRTTKKCEVSHCNGTYRICHFSDGLFLYLWNGSKGNLLAIIRAVKEDNNKMGKPGDSVATTRKWVCQWERGQTIDYRGSMGGSLGGYGSPDSRNSDWSKWNQTNAWCIQLDPTTGGQWATIMEYIQITLHSFI
jgi:hypothetical protein